MGEEQLHSIIALQKVIIGCSEIFQSKIEIVCYDCSSKPRLISVLFIYILRTYDVFPSCIENNFIYLKNNRLCNYLPITIGKQLHKSWESPSMKHGYLTIIDGYQLQSLIHSYLIHSFNICVLYGFKIKSILPALTTRWPHLHRIWEN